MPDSQDYFQFLGLPRRLALNSNDLEERYYSLSRQWHPDLFARKSAGEQQQALDNTALLNDAFRTLRDPVRRAEYVLSLAGLSAAEQGSGSAPPELLEEVFDLNMALEEMRSGDEEARPQLEQARTRFLGMREGIDRDLQTKFSAYDASPSGAVLSEIRAILNRRNYVRNLIGEVEKTLHVGN